MRKLSRFLITVAILLFFCGVSVNAQGVKVGGYVQTWFLSQQNEGYAARPDIEDGVSGFRIRRARLNFKTDINEIFSINAWLEFSDVQKALLDFKASAKICPELIVSVGQFMTPAQMNETSNILSSKIPFYDRSDISLKLSNYMGHDSFRDVGMMAGGTIEKVLNYGIYYGNGNGRLNYAGTTIINRKFGQGLIGGRLDFEPVKGLVIGGHYSINKQDSVNTGTTAAPSISSKDRSSFSFNIGSDGFGLPALYTQFEYGNGKVDEILKNSKTEYNGWYVTLAYKVIPALQVLFRYDAYKETVKSTKGLADVTGENKNITAGLNYYFFKENAEIVKIGLNYESRKEDPTDLRNNIFVLWTQFKF